MRGCDIWKTKTANKLRVQTLRLVGVDLQAAAILASGMPAEAESGAEKPASPKSSDDEMKKIQESCDTLKSQIESFLSTLDKIPTDLTPEQLALVSKELSEVYRRASTVSLELLDETTQQLEDSAQALLDGVTEFDKEFLPSDLAATLEIVATELRIMIAQLENLPPYDFAPVTKQIETTLSEFRNLTTAHLPQDAKNQIEAIIGNLVGLDGELRPGLVRHFQTLATETYARCYDLLTNFDISLIVNANKDKVT